MEFRLNPPPANQVPKISNEENRVNLGNGSPNVVFISIDDLNDWIGVLDGYVDVKTPNIDRLASQGMVFKNAHTPVPVCNAARTAAMTGLQPDTTGVFDNGQDWRDTVPDGATLPEYFRDNGYQSIGAGKLFHIQKSSVFDQYFQAPDVRVPDDKGRFGSAASEAPIESYRDVQVAEFASNYLGQDHADPFFLGLGFSRPHVPLTAPQEFFDLYPLEDIQLPNVDAVDDLLDIPVIGQELAGELHQSILRTGDWAEIVQAYLANISFVDAQIGRVLDAIENNGLAENTVIALWSDHGWHLGEKLHWQKRTLWEEATRVPLIVSAPGVTEPGSSTDAPVSLVDLFPTLVDLTGLPEKPDVEGNSLTPLLNNPEAEWQNSVVSTWDNSYAVRSQRWRYIRYWDGTEELYDHQTDPNEFNNLADDPDALSTKVQLSQELNDYFEKYAPERLPAADIDQVLMGDDSDNLITGGAHNDTIIGEGGDDTLFGGAGANDLQGGIGNDFISHASSEPGLLQGNSGNDTLIGGDGDDTLDGGLGEDVLEGRGGSNTYVINSAGDRILSTPGEFGSTVITSVNWRLPDGFTRLELEETAEIGRGNSEKNILLGNQRDNSLFGEGGKDRLYGGNGSDLLHGGEDNDRLRGGKGNDTLEGGTGNNVLIGGSGIDTLVVEAIEQTIELSNTSVSGDGFDQIQGIENAVLKGNEADNLLDASQFKGSSEIRGNGGDDTLIPSHKTALLVGGEGADQFILTRLRGTDIQILDFDTAAGDVIAIAANILGAELALQDRVRDLQFGVGDQFQTHEQRFLIDSEHTLWFDPDGVGSNEGFRLAQLGTNATLTAKDLRIV